MPEFDSTIRYAPIHGFIGYMVGTDGSIWSNRAMGRRRKKERDKPVFAQWHQMKTPPPPSGYSSITIHEGGINTTLLVHRLVLLAFVGPCPAGMEACHDPDPCRTNCKLENLRWGTRKSNSADRGKHGNEPRGEDRPNAVLTESIVREARTKYANGASVRELSIIYGVPRQTLSCAVRRRTWRHIA